MKKSKISTLIILMFFLCKANYAQKDTTQNFKREYVAYTFFYNVVPDNFNFPLVGFVNVAKGNHKGLQVGFVNTTLKDFKGAQIGFVNTVLRDTKGEQIGFLNLNKENHKGLQVGFVNTTLKDFTGAQIGFVNTVLRDTKGGQIGFINLTSGKLKGLQLGFLNIVDSVDSGIPIGFLSIVKKGGYHAIELSMSEMYPVNFAFKSGLDKFYSYIKVSYNPELEKQFAYGLGVGSLINIGKSKYFNPEIESTINSDNHQMISFVPNVRYNIMDKFQISIGPSFVWYHNWINKKLNEPFFSIYDNKINDSSNLLIGIRTGISFNF